MTDLIGLPEEIDEALKRRTTFLSKVEEEILDRATDPQYSHLGDEWYGRMMHRLASEAERVIIARNWLQMPSASDVIYSLNFERPLRYESHGDREKEEERVKKEMEARHLAEHLRQFEENIFPQSSASAVECARQYVIQNLSRYFKLYGMIGVARAILLLKEQVEVERPIVTKKSDVEWAWQERGISLKSERRGGPSYEDFEFTGSISILEESKSIRHWNIIVPLSEEEFAEWIALYYESIIHYCKIMEA